MGLPSVRLKLMLMLSTILMEDTILDTLLLAMVMDMVLAMPAMGMESVMLRLSPRLMLSMEPMVDMVMDLDTVHTPLDTVMVMVLDMDMDIMVEILGTTNQEQKTEFTQSPFLIRLRQLFLSFTVKISPRHRIK